MELGRELSAKPRVRHYPSMHFLSAFKRFIKKKSRLPIAVQRDSPRPSSRHHPALQCISTSAQRVHCVTNSTTRVTLSSALGRSRKIVRLEKKTADSLQKTFFLSPTTGLATPRRKHAFDEARCYCGRWSPAVHSAAGASSLDCPAAGVLAWLPISR